ncbi:MULTISPECIES: hypothetical protein [unclassified Streptomyces]|uniref:hypothetical protein n=1 Tax=unclassified Streptomyces TaxID=2593676 RepID=UPI00136E2312|nr:hypothetical protein [Streptomyces sp. MnatMP-M77]MYT78120.1 hypothetical protein [Streptomyces sp. SID8364]
MGRLPVVARVSGAVTVAGEGVGVAVREAAEGVVPRPPVAEGTEAAAEEAEARAAARETAVGETAVVAASVVAVVVAR